MTWTGDAGEPDVTTVDDDQTMDDTTPDIEDDITPDLEAADRGELIAESKKYRARAQTAEAALQTAQTQLEAAQRHIVEGLASDLATPADVLTVEIGGVELEALLDDEGNVDPDAVRGVVASILEARPGLARDYGIPAQFSDTGQGKNATRHRNKKGPTWAEVIKPPKRMGV